MTAGADTVLATRGLAKAFGGTDGHKFVNGVLDKLAPVLRAAEVKAAKR